MNRSDLLTLCRVRETPAGILADALEDAGEPQLAANVRAGRMDGMHVLSALAEREVRHRSLDVVAPADVWRIAGYRMHGTDDGRMYASAPEGPTAANAAYGVAMERELLIAVHVDGASGPRAIALALSRVRKQ